MWQPRLIESARMKYLGIVEALEADVRSGRVARGERLPPQRDIAEALDVDLTTVTRAFNEARRRGLVEAQAGRGTFISEKLQASGPTEPRALIDLSMNIPPQPAGMDFRKIVAHGISGILGGPRGQLSFIIRRATAQSPIACRGRLAGFVDRGRLCGSDCCNWRRPERALRGLRAIARPRRCRRCRGHDLSRA